MGFLAWIKNGIKGTYGLQMPAFFPASRTTYDNTQSGLSANRVQAAIDELNDEKVSKSGDTMSGPLTISNSAATQLSLSRNHSGTSSVSSIAYIGNNIPDGTAGCSDGILRIYGEDAYYTGVEATNTTVNRQVFLPDASGTLALTSDLNSCINYTYIGDGVGAGAGEHDPYFDFAANNCEGGFYICVLINQNLDNPKRESITFVTVRSTGQVRSFIPDSDSNWSKDGTKIVGRMASHYSNIKVYKINNVL